jgi:hypothetical protein
MRYWCNVLPMFLVRLYAQKHGERFMVPGVGICVVPFDDVIIVVVKEPNLTQKDQK